VIVSFIDVDQETRFIIISVVVIGGTGKESCASIDFYSIVIAITVFTLYIQKVYFIWRIQANEGMMKSLTNIGR